MLFGFLPVFITLGGGYFLFRLRAFFVFHPRKTLACVRAHCKGEGKSAFSRMSLALAGTLGVGNVTGVAAGILIGGAGSVFWLLVSALFSAPLKYAESVAMLSANAENAGARLGFPSLVRQRLGRLGTPLSRIYAALSVALALCMGSALQCAAAVESARSLNMKSAPRIILLLFVFLLVLCILGSPEKICKATSILIPFAMILYTILCIIVIISNISRIFSVVRYIFLDAFTARSLAGGVVGTAVASPLKEGFLRGLLSNEAGAGTSAYAHAKSEKNDPVAEGILGMGEILFDTVILCMLTAFSILLSVEDVSLYKSGMELLSAAFSSVLGKAYRLPLLSSVFLFALSTAVCWYEYGRCALSYLGQKSGIAYLLIYVAFALFGAWLGSMALIPLCDAILFFLCAIALPTLIKSGTAVCALTEKALRIGKGDHRRGTYGSP